MPVSAFPAFWRECNLQTADREKTRKENSRVTLRLYAELQRDKVTVLYRPSRVSVASGVAERKHKAAAKHSPAKRVGDFAGKFSNHHHQKKHCSIGTLHSVNSFDPAFIPFPSSHIYPLFLRSSPSGQPFLLLFHRIRVYGAVK